jgi:dTDP-4-amino-4,6-dideoxygalactose transaminase
MTSAIPFNDLGRYTREVGSGIGAATQRVIESGWFLLGPETERFEQAFAIACGADHAVAVANGTDALEIALRALGCEPGDEVITVANAGMYATTATLAIGAVPVFADVDPATLLLDLDQAATLVTDRTRVVVATHLYGNVVDVPRLRAALPAGVAVLEDAAQAHGASLRSSPVGSLGAAAAFSFYPTKNLGALGDAGAIVTSDAALARRARALRQYGWTEKYAAGLPGGRNSRIDEIQAAVLLVLLPELGARNARRRAIWQRCTDAMAGHLQPTRVTDGAEQVAHLCVGRTARRREAVDGLAARGIATAIHYPIPDHRQEALHDRPFRRAELVHTEQACDQVLSLPCFPELTDAEVARVAEALQELA